MSKNSPQGHSGTIVITSAQWGRIEGACGFSFSPLLQADIVRASEAYLLAERFGRTGDFLAKVKVILESHDKGATRFFKELFADHSAVSDAGVYAHYLIENESGETVPAIIKRTGFSKATIYRALRQSA